MIATLAGDIAPVDMRKLYVQKRAARGQYATQ